MKLTVHSLIILLCFILAVAYGRNVDDKLKRHGVDKSMQRSISGMSKSGLSHENIVKNVARHYPTKSKSEINDIVIAANIATKSNQARGATKKKNGKH